MTSVRMSDALETLRQEIAGHLADQAYIIWDGADYPAPKAIADAIRAGEFTELTHTMDAIEDLVSGLTNRYLSDQHRKAYGDDAAHLMDSQGWKRGNRR